jgi:hypothetical protein
MICLRNDQSISWRFGGCFRTGGQPWGMDVSLVLGSLPSNGLQSIQRNATAVKDRMLQTISCKAEKFSDSQETRNFMEPEDSLARFHDTTIFPILSQTNAVRTILSCYCKTHMNIIAPHVPRFSK